jgi:predicted metal-dependent RNase
MNWNSARVLIVGGPPLESDYAFRIRQILAHNDDKRKKIMLVTGLEAFDEAASHRGDAVWVGEEGAYHGD